ncbi:MAG: DnaJ domain-containing protein [Collinsella sp.]|nr:DnaJ domain-containing protein [Collinsella sp.]
MATMNEKDYYAILGVSKDATTKEIQKAFQQKARKLHPDVNKAPDAEERFKEVSEAYAVLSDEGKRARYDAMRSGSPFASAGGAGPSAAPYGGGYGGGFPFGFPFDTAFGGRRRGSAYKPEEGADVVVEVDLEPEQARAGARRAVTYRRYGSCDHCHGSGSVSTDHARTCPTCGGTGAISVDMSTLFGMGTLQMVCPECGGSGKVVADPCPQCGGSGRSAVTSEAVVEFPAGTHDGDVVRLKGMGHAGTNGANGGDLVARARVATERLEGRAATGFHMVGVVMPFLLFSALSGVLSLFLLLCLIPLAFGLYLIASEGILRRPLLWWKRGLSTFASGALNGVLFAYVAVTLASCSQGILLAPYGMIG